MKHNVFFRRKFLTEVFNRKLILQSPIEPIHRLRHTKCEKEIALMFEAAKITGQVSVLPFDTLS